MFEQLAGDDDVEACVLERQRRVDVGPARLDAELGRLCERLAIDVDADHVVALHVHPGQCAVAAPEIQHAPPRPADVLAKQLDALLARVDELACPSLAVVLAVALAEVLEAAHPWLAASCAPATRHSRRRRTTSSTVAPARRQSRKSHGTR